MPRKVEISYRTIIFITVFVLALWLLYQIREVILVLFVSLILMSSLNQSVEWLERFKIPRVLAIFFFYLMAVGVLAFGIVGVIPPLIEQTTNLIDRIPDFFLQFKVLGIDEKVIASQLSQFSSIPANLFQFVVGLFSNIIAILGMGVITFYLLLERKNLDRYLMTFFGDGQERKIEAIIDKIENKLGGWVRGELLLMTFVGALNYLGFRIINLEFALPLAILSFLFEVVPNIGPTLAAFPAILIGLTISPVHALVVAGWCFLVQQIENSILVPKIMNKTAGVNPLVSILSLAVGFKIAGIGGAILGVPTYLVLEVIASEILSSERFKRG